MNTQYQTSFRSGLAIVFLILLNSLTLIKLKAQDFIVAPGVTKTLTTSDRNLNVHKLILGDNSTILIPPSMTGWDVIADDVVIGQNVKIIGIGSAGKPGSNGAKGASATQNCQLGGNGQNGVIGLNGAAGKSINLKLRIRSFGNLHIQVYGGSGGNGGRGGDGGKGGSASCFPSGCSGGKGGNGGNGANGGKGGMGGNVKIEYRKIGNISIDPSKFVVQNNGGAGGVAGVRGMGGSGGLKADCSFGPDKPAGPNGLNGLPGANGSQGTNGSKTISIY